MSVSELRIPTRVKPAAERRRLSGWGRSSWSWCSVVRPKGEEEVLEALAAAGRQGRRVIARGAGCSYGDAALNDGGDVLDMRDLDRIISIDPEAMLVRAQAGATIGALMARLSAYKLTLPVVPGTRHVTLAGAIASDIHGKNHHRDGAFARHVRAMTLCMPAGDRRELTPDSDGELFYATLGGMGLTGVVVEATLQAEPLGIPWVSAEVDRTESLGQTLELLSGREEHRYSVAWLDLLAEGPKMGRAIVSRADPLEVDTPTPSGRGRGGARRSYPGALTRSPALEVPRAFPTRILRPGSVRAFNALHWSATPRVERERPLALAPFFFPLDVLGQWNRLYGAQGLTQYQFVIPTGRESDLEGCFELIRARRIPVYLAVFKRFGPAFGGPLSFPLEGWTLAVDIPTGAPGLEGALRELDELVAGCGGRVYLTKDSRLSPEMLQAMYPELDRFQEQRSGIDQGGLLRSDLGERLGLCGV